MNVNDFSNYLHNDSSHCSVSMSISKVLLALVTSVKWLPVKFHKIHESIVPNNKLFNFIASFTPSTLSINHLIFNALKYVDIGKPVLDLKSIKLIKLFKSKPYYLEPVHISAWKWIENWINKIFCPIVKPYNCIVKWFTGCLIPNYSCFTLITQTNTFIKTNSFIKYFNLFI